MNANTLVLATITAIISPDSLQARPEPALKQVASANNAFAIDLYSRLAATPGNLFLSPLLIEASLTMAYAGARGETAVHIARVLHLPRAPADIHNPLSRLVKELDSNNAMGCELVIANSLWVAQELRLLRPFLNTCTAQHGAFVGQVDFLNAAEAGRQQINRWVADRTHEKVRNLFPPGALSRQDRIVLGNAIYFRGLWSAPFPRVSTSDAPFYTTREENVSVPVMHRRDGFMYNEAEGVQLLELAYLSNHLSMVIFLPKERDGLPEFERSLTLRRLEQLMRKMHLQEVAISLPRFKCASYLSLADALRAMGMSDAFSPQEADFSGMANEKPLFISTVLHKGALEVDEEGTEAAVGAAAAISTGFAPHFIADHPFLFLIRHSPTGAILFIGRVANPLSDTR